MPFAQMIVLILPSSSVYCTTLLFFSVVNESLTLSALSSSFSLGLFSLSCFLLSSVTSGISLFSGFGAALDEVAVVSSVESVLSPCSAAGVSEPLVLLPALFSEAEGGALCSLPSLGFSVFVSSKFLLFDLSGTVFCFESAFVLLLLSGLKLSWFWITKPVLGLVTEPKEELKPLLLELPTLALELSPAPFRLLSVLTELLLLRIKLSLVLFELLLLKLPLS